MLFSAGLISGAIGAALAALLRAAVVGLLHGLIGPIATYLLRTPDLLAQPGLRTLWLAGLGCFTVLAALFVAVSAAASISGHPRHAAATVLSRLGVCWVTAALALPLLALEAQLSNDLVGVFIPAATTQTTGPLVASLLAAAQGSGTARLDLLAVAAVGTVLLGALAVQALLRWAVVWLLVVLAPLAMLLGLLPGDAGTVTPRLWWRLQAGALALPVVNAALLACYAAMFAGTTGLTAALAGVGVLGLLSRLPVWAAGQVVHPVPRDVLTPTRRLALDVSRGVGR